MSNGTYGGVRGRKTKVGRKLLRFPPTRFYSKVFDYHLFMSDIFTKFTYPFRDIEGRFLTNFLSYETD